MKSKIIQNKKIECENTNKITFTTFNINDSKSFTLSVGCFDFLEPEFKNGIQVMFSHKTSDGKISNFMTIIWPCDIVDHSDMTIAQTLKVLVNRRIRLFEDIFSVPYFDYSDVCFPNKVVHVKNSNKKW